MTLEAGKSLTINGGGSQTVWSAAGIHTQTAGGHTAYASSHATPKGRSQAVRMPVFPLAMEAKDHSVQLNVLKNTAYSFAGQRARIYQAHGGAGTLLGTALVGPQQATQPVHAEQAQTLVAFLGEGAWAINDHEHNSDGCGCGNHDDHEPGAHL